MDKEKESNPYDLMEYLSEKLLNRSEGISTLIKKNQYNTNNGYLGINLNYLVDIKTQLNQASLAIKALVSENKMLAQEVINYRNIVNEKKQKINNEIPLNNKNNGNHKYNNINNNNFNAEEIYFKIQEPKIREKKNIIKSNSLYPEYSSEILMKISNNPSCITPLKRQFGNNFMKKIISKDVDYDYLNEIDKIIDDTIQKYKYFQNEKKKKNYCENLNESLNLPLRIKMVNQDYYDNFNNSYNVSNSFLNKMKRSKSYSYICPNKTNQKNTFIHNQNKRNMKINQLSPNQKNLFEHSLRKY